MSRRPSPLEQMRQLADDGMEPWQIAAALGVREQAVLVALGDRTPAGGAVRAVEQAASLEASDPVEKPAAPAVELEHAFVDRTPPTPPALRHVHDPFVAWHETGVPYATCACGTTWERQTCEACPAIVAALRVATHGPIHKHCAAKKTAAKKTATERTNP